MLVVRIEGAHVRELRRRVSVLAIDPGTTESAYVLYDPDTRGLVEFGKVYNAELLMLVREPLKRHARSMAIEMIASYGMPVGAEVFETCVWIGRFIEGWIGIAPGEPYRVRPHGYVYRREVKSHLCGSMKAKDSNVRVAIEDLYGGRKVARGSKAAPGPLHGVTADVWAALAVAITWCAAR